MSLLVPGQARVVGEPSPTTEQDGRQLEKSAKSEKSNKKQMKKIKIKNESWSAKTTADDSGSQL